MLRMTSPEVISLGFLVHQTGDELPGVRDVCPHSERAMRDVFRGLGCASHKKYAECELGSVASRRLLLSVFEDRCLHVCFCLAANYFVPKTQCERLARKPWRGVYST